MVDRVKYPPGAAKRIERMLLERERLERKHLRTTARDAEAFVAAVRAAIDRHEARPWTLPLHARIIRQLRGLGHQFGAAVSVRARDAARAMAALAAEHQTRGMAIFATAALGRKVVPVAVNVPAAMSIAVPAIDARTDGIGARSGEELAQVAISASFLETRKTSPLPAALVGLAIANMLRPRALDRAERVVITEATAGGAEGGDAARIQLVKRFPKLRKVWDATLDRRVCRLCASLHHVVVDAGEGWPSGVDDAPAHARCRCCTQPWLDDWSDTLNDMAVAPGPRVGVQEHAELRLPSFTALAPEGLGSS